MGLRLFPVILVYLTVLFVFTEGCHYYCVARIKNGKAEARTKVKDLGTAKSWAENYSSPKAIIAFNDKKVNTNQQIKKLKEKVGSRYSHWIFGHELKKMIKACETSKKKTPKCKKKVVKKTWFCAVNRDKIELRTENQGEARKAYEKDPYIYKRLFKLHGTKKATKVQETLAKKGAGFEAKMMKMCMKAGPP